MRLLLINPKHPESFWSFRWAVDDILPHKRTINPPLGLATIAALCPAHWEVTIVDENVESVPLAPQADLIGICGMGVQFPRQRELLDYYRTQGYYVVAGGSFASLCPERYTEIADTVVAGEAEYIWKRFCEDFERGAAVSEYRETGVVDLKDSPAPRFDLLKLDRYTTATLQFSRGCPYRCEFCDIIVMFGRKPRHKTPEQVGRELDALAALGAYNVFFVDDNLIGNRNVAKQLLRYLKQYQALHGNRFQFGTEVSLNLAQDAELLELMREAGFGWTFIGIESPDPATLKATLKTQNLHEDPLASVRRIHAAGIDVLAGFIIGFDADTKATFDVQHNFIMDTGIQAAMVGLLTALPHTPLHARLEEAGRLLPDAQSTDNTGVHTNVVPLHMTRDELAQGYLDLYTRLLSDRGIAGRVRSKLKHFGRPVTSSVYTWREQLQIVARLFTRGIAPGGPGRIWQFLTSLPWLSPSRVPVAINDWIAGLSMRRYVEERLRPTGEDAASLIRRARALRASVKGYLRSGKVTLGIQQASVPQLALSLHGLVDARFFRRAGRALESWLRETHAGVTLRIDGLHTAQRRQVQALLDRLTRYGDRVSLVLDERARSLVRIDSSVFNLVLAPPVKANG
jgi:radical SAM superfamily enzyme YgiQ (UPF0313 family)